MSEREQRIVLLLAGDTKGMPLGRQGSLLDSGSASRNLLCPQFFAYKGLAHWRIVGHSELKTSYNRIPLFHGKPLYSSYSLFQVWACFSISFTPFLDLEMPLLLEYI